jgi:hypothetical protein
MRSKTVPADAEDYRSGCGDLEVNVAKLASLICSARGIVFGIKEDYDFLPKIITQSDRFAADSRQGEFRGRLSYADFLHSLLSFLFASIFKSSIA